MTHPIDSDSTLCISEEVLEVVQPGHAHVKDAPVSAQALLCLDLFQGRRVNILWIAADVREMERRGEVPGIHALDDAIAPNLDVYEVLKLSPE